jgi:hypothetical protein
VEYLDLLQVLQREKDGAGVTVNLRQGIIQAHLLATAQAA